MRFLKKFIQKRRKERHDKPLIVQFQKDLIKEFGSNVTLKQDIEKYGNSVYEVYVNGVSFGIGRITNRHRNNQLISNEKPLKRITASERAEYEWECCALGYAKGITPRPIWKNANSIIVSKCPGESYQNHIKKEPEKFWQFAIRASETLHTYHTLGRSHMDANMSNIVGDADCTEAYLIDFEYLPHEDVCFAQQKAFDHIRLIESATKFLPDSIKQQSKEWEHTMRTMLDKDTKTADLKRLSHGMQRINNDKFLLRAISNVFTRNN